MAYLTNKANESLSCSVRDVRYAKGSAMYIVSICKWTLVLKQRQNSSTSIAVLDNEMQTSVKTSHIAPIYTL